MEPTHWPINRLVSKFVDKEIRMPEIQRKFVWKPEKVRALIDSVYKDYPSGSILLWETTEMPEMAESALAPRTEPSLKAKWLLLDGQQRLTSLAAVMTGTPVQTRRGKKEERTIEVYFNLEHPATPGEVIDEPDDEDEDDDIEESDIAETPEALSFFQIRNSKIENKPNWVSVTALFREGVGTILEKKQLDPSNPNYKKYLERLNRLYNKKETYFYPIQILQSDKKYEEVTEVFVRVNSAGVKLRSSDLALAQVTSRWRGAMKIFSGFVEECEKVDYYLDEGFVIKCLVSMSTGQSRFERIDKVKIERLQNDWEKTKKAILFTINFLKKNALIETSKIIPALFILIPICVMTVKQGFKFSSQQERSILRWFYAALMWGRYSRGSTETALDEDINIVNNSQTPIEDMLKKVLAMSGRLDVKESDLEGKGVQSTFFRMTYVIARKNNARDWGTGLAFSLENIGNDWRREYDHIFPTSKLEPYLWKKYAVDQSVKKLVNDMANIAFLSKRNNIIKGGKLPEVYFPGILQGIGEESLTAQNIPLEKNLWSIEHYEDFLSERRRLIAKSINALMKSLESSGKPYAEQSIEEKITEPESNNFEVKGSMIWDYQTSSVNKALVLPIIKTIAAFLNTEGGALLVGVHDKTRDVLGLEKDFASFGTKGDWDTWLQTLVNAINTHLGKEIAHNWTPRRHVIGGKPIAEIVVTRSSKPIYVDPEGKADFYIRLGNTTHILNPRQGHDYANDHWGK